MGMKTCVYAVRRTLTLTNNVVGNANSNRKKIAAHGIVLATVVVLRPFAHFTHSLFATRVHTHKKNLEVKLAVTVLDTRTHRLHAKRHQHKR